MLDPEIYKETIADLKAFFPDKHLLSAVDVGKYTGHHRTTCSKYYGIGRQGISIFSLARKLSNK